MTKIQKNSMKEIERLILEKLLAELRLQKALMQYNNKYVFGFDDTERFILNKISILDF